VKAGDLLFVIEREPYKAALDQATASVKSAEAELAQAKSDLSRIEQAIQNRAVSEQDLDAARAKLLRAEASLLSAQAVQDRAELDYSYTLVRSPIDGQVSRNFVDPGNLVGTGEATSLTTVNQMQPIYVYFEAPERLVLNLLALSAEGANDPISEAEDTARRGEAFVKLSNETAFGHPGHIDYIDNTVNPNTGTIQLRVVCPNEDLTMFPGLFVRVRVSAPTSREAILVAERAVGTDLGGKYVMVLDEQNVVEQRYVVLGQPQDDGTVVVESGLDGTERYVVNGMLRARPGLPVQPLPPGASDPSGHQAGGAK
jgi:RND family efflux transporter MFP subunit